jgi:general secretion pathway protein I
MRRAEAGFTLIELLIAFVIAAGGLTAVFQLLSGNMAGMSRAQAREHATLIAQSRLAELQAGAALTAGSLQGQADGRFSWAASVQPYGPALTNRQGQAIPLYSLIVTVRWREGASQQQVTLNTLHLGLPATAQP